jgi:hypothetical protein
VIAQIAKAIMNKYNGETELKNALTGGLYFQQAPQGATFPYGVFYFNGATQQEIMGAADDSIQEVDIQFNLFSEKEDGGEELAILSELFNTAFNWQDIYASGYHYIKMQRENILPLIYVDEIWQITTNYSLWIQKN